MAQSSIHTDKIARAAASGAASSFTSACMMLCECSAKRWLRHRSGVKLARWSSCLWHACTRSLAAVFASSRRRH
eukprot:933063-Pleurochrysis_carterae.AAC.1